MNKWFCITARLHEYHTFIKIDHNIMQLCILHYSKYLKQLRNSKSGGKFTQLLYDSFPTGPDKTETTGLNTIIWVDVFDGFRCWEGV